MTSITDPGTGVLFMKVGTHAQEDLADIIRRKTKEIEDAGHAFWGYGGGTCHPTNMVQPFAQDFEKGGGVIYLCMQPMVSRHFAPPKRAKEFSLDGVKWQEVPAAINVVGSRYALAIDQLHEEEFELPLAHTTVALGNSVGKPGSKYVTGRVDKACLVVTAGTSDDESEVTAHIGLVARLVPPYAVFLRNEN